MAFMHGVLFFGTAGTGAVGTTFIVIERVFLILCNPSKEQHYVFFIDNAGNAQHVEIGPEFTKLRSTRCIRTTPSIGNTLS